MKPRTVTAVAGASIANLGPGFDVLGVALEHPVDKVIASRRKEPGVGFELRTQVPDVPDGPENVAAHVAALILGDHKPGFGATITLHKEMAVGSGLGSSAASSVAAAMAVNALLPTPLPRRDLLPYALEGERKASGAAHADNAAAALLGGAVLVRSYDPLDVITLPLRGVFLFAVLRPHRVLPTRIARRLLPFSIALPDAVRQWGNVGAVVAALARGDAALLGRSLEDRVAEPVRASLIPGYADAKRAALESGA
jgi:homoserine kinase